MRQCLTWFFGRGVSIACNFKWVVPYEWKCYKRDEQILMIKKQLKIAMDSEGVNTLPYKNLLSILSTKTKPDWCHQFITTNWDYLLEREINNLNLQVLPKWLCNSFVFHLNGTIEELPDNSNRSPFLLETDNASDRKSTVEANIAFNKIAWQKYFVIVGVSFSCEMDKYTLAILNSVEDYLPIGESYWIAVNPDQKELDNSLRIIQGYLPRAKFYAIKKDFKEWVSSGLAELISITGVLSS